MKINTSVALKAGLIGAAAGLVAALVGRISCIGGTIACILGPLVALGTGALYVYLTPTKEDLARVVKIDQTTAHDRSRFCSDLLWEVNALCLFA